MTDMPITINGMSVLTVVDPRRPLPPMMMMMIMPGRAERDR